MSEDKRFPPTPSRLKKARAKGDVAKSRDITGACVVLGGFAALCLSATSAGGEVLKYFQTCFSIPGDTERRGDFLSNRMLLSGTDFIWVLLGVLLPCLLAVFISCLLSEVWQSGVQFQWGGAAWRSSRVNPLSGLKRMFEPHTCIELIKAVFIWGMGLLILWSEFRNSEDMLRLVSGKADTEVALGFGAIFQFLKGLLARLAMLGLGVGIFDFFLQRYRWRRRHMMSFEELKNELKESEGNPEVKVMRRQLHQELLAKSTVDSVRRAKVLVIGRRQESSERLETG